MPVGTDFTLSLGFLSGYSRQFAVALSMWPLASMFLTLPLLAFLYHRDGRLRFWSAVGAYLCVLYGLSLVCFTLYPLPTGDSGLGITYGAPVQLDPLAFVGDLRRDGLRAALQIAFNVVFFVPLGFIAGRALRLSLPWALVIGFAVSLLIEVAQLTGLFFLYPYAYRTFDVDDLVWNTSGALIGWGCAALSKRLLPSAIAGVPADTTRPGFVRRCVAFCLDMALMTTLVLVLCAGLQVVIVLGLRVPAEALYAEASWAVGVAVAVFLLFEGILPWMRGGQTLGGDFVRMTFETCERHGVRRLVFYAARLATIALAVGFPPIVVPILAVFYFAVRCMPYDYI